MSGRALQAVTRSAAGVRAAVKISRVAWAADRRTLVTAFGGTLLASVLGALGGLWMKLVIDAVASRDMVKAMTAIGLMVGSTTVAHLTANVASQRMPQLADRIYLDMRERVLVLASRPQGLAHLDSNEYRDHLEMLRTTGSQDLNGIVGVIAGTLSLVGGLGISAGLLFTIHPAMPLLLLVAVVPVVMARRITEVLRKGADDSDGLIRLGRSLGWLVFEAGPAKELRVYGCGHRLREEAFETTMKGFRITFRAQLKAAFLELMAWLPIGVGYGVAIAVAAVLASQHRLSLGEVMLALGVAGILQGQLASLAGTAGGLARAAVFVERYQWIEEHSLPGAPRTAPAPDRLETGIALEGVGFRYPGADADVLSGVNLFIPAGSILALVGDNGAGKSTLVKLLCGFYEPTTGSITVDGQPLETIDTASWRARMTAVFQDFMRYWFRLREVVGVGRVEAVDDTPAVMASIDGANAGDIVEALPEGIETQLGADFLGGTELSGGQWQKLAVARMQMRPDPLLLVLDEPTGALDAESEEALFRRYTGTARAAAQQAGTITVLVSHRFSTVRMADVIAVVEDGKITESGTHDALMASGGAYAELYALQAKAYS